VNAIPLVLLIDADPPSDVGGGRGFYPATPAGAPPDAGVLTRRFDAIERFLAEAADGIGVVTVHTSPRFRTDLLEGPWPERWRRLAATGATLALHPHEERADGTSLYDDADHLNRVVAGTLARARAEGLALPAFRSGGSSFHPALPDILTAHGIGLDLSAAPGLADPRRAIDWPAAVETAPAHVGTRGARLPQVPLGWDGEGTDLARNYLFNEKTDLAGLLAVFDAMRRRAETRGDAVPAAFLVHGFGLVDERFRAQAARFLARVTRDGARLADARDFMTEKETVT